MKTIEKSKQYQSISEEEILFLDKDEGNGSNPQLENEKKIQSMIDELNELKNKL